MGRQKEAAFEPPAFGRAGRGTGGRLAGSPPLFKNMGGGPEGG